MDTTDADRAYHQIKDLILTVRMRPGAVIDEAKLMAELGLGRTPIREGLKRLQSEKLVNVRPRRGMFVAGIAITDLTQIYEVRVNLEPLGAQLAAKRIDGAQRDRLVQLLGEFREMDGQDKRKLIQIDQQFHCLIAEATHNNFLQNEICHFYDLSLRIWHLAMHLVQPEDLDVDAHLGIGQAILSRDPAMAEARMRVHIEQFHHRVKQYL